jgi:hypothetical protein
MEHTMLLAVTEYDRVRIKILFADVLVDISNVRVCCQQNDEDERGWSPMNVAIILSHTLQYQAFLV